MDGTRRAFLVAGGGAAVATLAFWAGATLDPGTPRPSGQAHPVPRGAGAYVDIDGWMLSPDDPTRFVAEGGGGETR